MTADFSPGNPVAGSGTAIIIYLNLELYIILSITQSAIAVTK
jgi:hypothetical protein